MNLPGNGRRKPKASFRFLRAQSLAYGFLVFGTEGRLIEQFDENAGLRFEDGIHALSGYFRPASDRLNGHAGIAFLFEELPGGFDNPSAGIRGLPLANQGFVGTPLGLRQTAKIIASFTQ